MSAADEYRLVLANTIADRYDALQQVPAGHDYDEERSMWLYTIATLEGALETFTHIYLDHQKVAA